MAERKYSVSEIERMRRAIEHQWLFGRRVSEPDPNLVIWTNKDGHEIRSTSTMSRSYHEEEKTKAVEERLRTYMLAGVDPAELE